MHDVARAGRLKNGDSAAAVTIVLKDAIPLSQTPFQTFESIICYISE